MEQDITAAATIPVMNSVKQKDGKGWKIATAIASVVAVCGIGFGIYGINQEGVILVSPLADINQWEVDSFYLDDEVVY